MTTISPLGVTFVQTAEALALHLGKHQLPEPVLLGVMTMGARLQVRAQLRSRTVAGIAAELLIWADTLSTVTIAVRQVPEGDRVQLSLTSTLTSPAGAVELDVYGGCAHDPALIVDLVPGDKRIVPLAQVRSWAARTPGAIGEGGAA